MTRFVKKHFTENGLTTKLQIGNDHYMVFRGGDGPSADELAKAATQVAGSGYFSPASLNDERERKLREIVERRGQPDFRKKLIVAYGGRCAVTSCDAPAALEAAHIIPSAGPQSHHVTNGLLLRADIHTSFGWEARKGPLLILDGRYADRAINRF